MEQVADKEQKVVVITGGGYSTYHNSENPCWHIREAEVKRLKTVSKSHAEKFYDSKCRECDWEE